MTQYVLGIMGTQEKSKKASRKGRLEARICLTSSKKRIFKG
jgi:hypothetical protein